MSLFLLLLVLAGPEGEPLFFGKAFFLDFDACRLEAAALAAKGAKALCAPIGGVGL